jgi:GDP-L-fucose synthase
VLPALIRKMGEADAHDENEVVIWRMGALRLEFPYGDDSVDACTTLLRLAGADFRATISIYHPLINIGSDVYQKMHELAATVARVGGFDGALQFDTSSAERLGSTPKVGAETGAWLAYRAGLSGGREEAVV